MRSALKRGGGFINTNKSYMVQYEIREQLKYLMLSLLILGISISTSQFDVFGELSSSDKQEIKSLLDDTVKQFLERLLDKKSPTVNDLTLDDPPLDYLTTLNGSKTDIYDSHLTPPDIRHIVIHTSENWINASVRVNFYGIIPNASSILETSPFVYMYIAKVPPRVTYGSGLKWNNAVAQGWQRTDGIFEVPASYRINSSRYSTSELIISNSWINHTRHGEEAFNVNLNLGKIGIFDEDQYAVSFVAGDRAIINGSRWTVEDSVRGILFPPPEYTVTTTPESLDLKPGEVKAVKLGINSPVAMTSFVHLRPLNTSDLQSTVVTPIVEIAEWGTESAILNIMASQNPTSSRAAFYVPIFAGVYFPEAWTITPFEPLQFNSSLAVNVVSNEPFSLSIPPEVWATIYTIVISTIIGWSIPSIASYISSRKRRRNFLKYIITIDEKYDTQKNHINALRDWLSIFERKMQYALGNGEISESQYDLLKKKIDYYSRNHTNPDEQ